MTTLFARRFPRLSGYSINEEIYAGSRTAVYRALDDKSGHSVVLKFLQQEYPSFNDLLQFRNQYNITRNLNIEGIIHPERLEPYQNSYVLVMEDWGGISLDKYIKQQSLNLGEILHIGVQVASILQDLAKHQIIHKDIKPANIIIHPETQVVKLIDFSIASLLPQETQEIQSPNVLEGTLAYLAPEQTGRMNRGITYRVDFYSLGVTLYELCTGKLPFVSEDPLELIHCHLAKIPTPVSEVNPAVPEQVAAIVAKLMAKNAEDRYQTAIALKDDLQECLQQWQTTGQVAYFELGQRDFSDRFFIPEKLYGRQTEVQTLLAAFDRVAAGSTEMMLVAGFSGIGKTAVVNEVHKPIVRQRGYFIKGKFDQFNRDIPLSAFVQALRNLVGQLLTEADGQLAEWRDKILAAVGEQGQILIDVMPELEQIIGKQAIAPTLSGGAAQNRFNRLIQKFIAVFTTAAHPLVIFLDDLQWADLASLHLMKLLMDDCGYLLVIGAYRDNEVSPIHPLMLTVAELKKAGAIAKTIVLPPLRFEDINHLIADTLHCATDLTQPFTELVNRKTQGNPFFTTQFLKVLHGDGYITFNGDRHHWECNMAEIQALALTDDVLELMTQQLRKLPTANQTVLQLAACIGSEFDLNTLAIIAEQPPVAIAQTLWDILKINLILPTSQVYKFFAASEVPTDIAVDAINPVYRFPHDRIQQAAYSLIPPQQRENIHYRIGRLLLGHIPAADQAERLFEIVGHLNAGIGFVVDAHERLELAQLNIKAGCKAKASTAYGAAVEYLTTAIALLPLEPWETEYDLSLRVYTEIAEAAYLNADFAQMEEWTQHIVHKARTILDTIAVQQIRLTAMISEGKASEAIQMGLEMLRLLGAEFPAAPTSLEIEDIFNHTYQLWAGRSPLSLLELPQMSDQRSLAAMEIMTVLSPAAHRVQPLLLPFLICKQVEFSILQGNCAISIFSYADYGLLLCGMIGDLEAGYKFGQLSLAVLEQCHATTAKSRAGFLFNTFIRHWREPLHASLQPLLNAYQSGLETGDLECVALNAHTYCLHSYLAGEELICLGEQIESYRQAIAPLKQKSTLKYLSIIHQTVLNLLGLSAVPWELTGFAYNPAEHLFLAPIAQRDQNEAFHFHFHETMLAYVFGQYERAAQCLEDLTTALVVGLGQFPVALTAFYGALIHLKLYPQATSDQQGQILTKVAAQQEKLRDWAALAPDNFRHRWALVEAERSAILGDRLSACDYYDQAIAEAEQAHCIQDVAIANELAAVFYLHWGKPKIAQEYLTQAYYHYVRWGATAKVKDLETQYPTLLAPILQANDVNLSTTETVLVPNPVSLQTGTATQTRSSSTRNSSHVSNSLDLNTVLKASQSLSREIELDKLLATLLNTVLENVGADKGVLLMLHGEALYVEAIAMLGQETQTQTMAVSHSEVIPHQLINTVKRSLQPLVIVDGTRHPTFSTDPYIVQHQTKSILCLPIVQQNKLIAILYLENNVMFGAFTGDRLELLNFLCTQAAISLNNARLYQQVNQALQEVQYKEAQARGIFAAASDGLLITDLDTGRVIDANPAYCDFHGYSLAELLTLDPYDFIPRDRQNQFNAFLKTVKAGEKFIYQAHCKKQNGSSFVININAVPFQYNGQLCALSVVRDITESDQMQRAIAEKNQCLETTLRELQQAQLQMVQSEKMATLGNLVAGVAHEINNPIGFLNGSIANAKDYVQDLFDYLACYQENHPPTDTVQDLAEEIDLEFVSEDLPKLLTSMQSATNRICSISNSLRTFSRADTEHKINADLHEGIESTILILKYRLKANEFRPAIQIIQDYGEIPYIACFSGQLNQVWMNLLSNAIDVFDEAAHHSSFAELEKNPQTITLQTRLIPKGCVEIRVRDNGGGMTAEVKNRIFDHLFTTKDVGKGTGLGLAIARQIIEEKHGGIIQVESTVGQGTEFIIRLPLTR